MTTNLIKTDITAVMFYKNFILAGIGNHLHIYDSVSLVRLFVQPIFIGQKIHGIHDIGTNVIIFGGKNLKIVMLHDQDPVTIEIITHLDHDDWILDAAFDCPSEEISIICAHNIASLHKLNRKDPPILTVQGAEKCLLYNASIVNATSREMLILAGTVFSEIIIWAPKIGPETLYRLCGHEGVIFSVTYNEAQRLICSTSDDRSLRLWDINVNSLSMAIKYTQQVHITPRITLYGHTARVWRARILNNKIISVGEDSVINVWDFDGNLLRRILAHQNDCIWSLDVCEKRNMILSGGGDTGICLNPISNGICRVVLPQIDESDDQIKKLVLMKDGSMVCVTEKGVVWFFKSTFDDCIQIKKHDNLKNIMVELSDCRTNIIIAGFNSKLFLYELVNGNLMLTKSIQITPNIKLLSITWIGHDSLILCTSNGRLDELNLNNESKLYRGILPEMKERWVTAATVIHDLLIVGDRGGNVHAFKAQSLVQTFPKLHGRLGIACLIPYNNVIFSTGRDGTIKQIKVCNRLLKIISTVRLPFKWCAKVLPSMDMAIGFLESNFQVWSLSLRRTLLSIDCGGGHRSWDFKPHQTNNHFIYIKGKRVHSVTFPRENFHDIEQGFHSKEINDMFSIPVEDEIIIVSGGEDTTLRISKFANKCQLIFRNYLVQNFHLSSIRCLDVVQINNCDSSNKWLIVSGGGRAQLVISEMLYLNGMVHCTELQSHTLKGQHRNTENSMQGVADYDPETRIMDVKMLKINDNYVIFAGCSDAVLRIYIFQFENKTMELFTSIAFHEHCILKVSLIECNNKLIVLTMLTEGSLYFWDFSFLKNNLNNKDGNISPFQMLNLHQSGINSFSLKKLNEHTFLLASGGDDCCLKLTVIHINDELTVEIISNWETSTFHTAQITGILFIDNFLVSCAIDQRITLFEYKFAANKIECLYKSQLCSTVADLQGIINLAYSKDGDITVGVFGKGIEIVKLPCQH